MRNCFAKIKHIFRNQSDTPTQLEEEQLDELRRYKHEQQFQNENAAAINKNTNNSTIDASPLQRLNHATSDPYIADVAANDKREECNGAELNQKIRTQGGRERLRVHDKQDKHDKRNTDFVGYTSSPSLGVDSDKRSSGGGTITGTGIGSLRRLYGSKKKKPKKNTNETVLARAPPSGELLTLETKHSNTPITRTMNALDGVDTATADKSKKNTNNSVAIVDNDACFQRRNGSEDIIHAKPFTSKSTTKVSTYKSHTPHSASDAAADRKSYIAEYKTFVEDEKEHLIGTPFPNTEIFNFEAALNRSTISSHSLNAETRNSAAKISNMSTAIVVDLKYTAEPKTPEEIEYEATVAAERADVMTPLPSTSTYSSVVKPLSYTRALHSDIAEMIRNLDSNALRINNLSLEEKIELMRRFDNQHHSSHKSTGSNKTKSPLRVLYENSMASQTTSSTTQLEDESNESDTDSVESAVVLRRKVSQDYASTNQLSLASCLFERRQPKCPKLKLLIKCSQRETSCNYADEDIERLLMDVKFPTVLPPNPQLKALLVFHKTDNICEVVTEACHRQQLDVTVARTKEGALETLSNANGNTDFYHLIIIDARSTKHLDAEYIARSIRHTNGHHFTTIIAVVKKSFFEKDDVLIALLDAGVNRCVPETTNLAMCNIELKQILHSIVRPHNVMSTQQALYTALHRLKEVIIITDNLLRIQYANRAAERLLNMRLDEIISKPLTDIFVSDVSTITSQGKKNKEFDEILTVRRKSQEDVSMHVRVVPVACIGRTPTHFVFNFDVPGAHVDFVATLPQAKEAPRGSLHSIRRGSVDVRSVASDGLRRTSLAKLTSLPLEAPITKIINLLSQVQENCSPDEARLIDKVLEFLKREGLYSPQMKEIRPDDPIATDLIGALLTGPSLYSSRRSSNDSIIRVGCRTSSTMPAKMKATPLIMELLEESLSWEFDIFKLEEITEKRPLLYLGMEMFRRFDVFATLNIDENICKSWLAVMEANYHANNSYHNSTHAADVMQGTGVFLTQLAAKDMGMDRIDEAIALIAAAAHDVDHPGRSSAFLCNSNSSLAVLYNDLSVLESHHAATTFRLTLSDDKINIFKNLDTDTYKTVRSVIIDMILATEMTRHFEHLAKFVSVFGTEEEPREIVQSEEDSSILIRRMLIKVADVSNPARPFAYSVEWSRRIAEEYFSQTDEEKAKSLPIMMPMFDRNTCIIPKSQIGFIEYIIQDMMHAWDSFIDMPQLITYMQINYSQWKKFEEQGILTLADIKNKQASLNSKKSAK